MHLEKYQIIFLLRIKIYFFTLIVLDKISVYYYYWKTSYYYLNIILYPDNKVLGEYKCERNGKNMIICLLWRKGSNIFLRIQSYFSIINVWSRVLVEIMLVQIIIYIFFIYKITTKTYDLWHLQIYQWLNILIFLF